MFPLSSLKEGRRGKVVKIINCAKTIKKCSKKNGHDLGLGNTTARIAELGIRAGKTIELLQKGRKGPLLVKVDEARIAIGRGMADRIIITDE